MRSARGVATPAGRGGAAAASAIHLPGLVGLDTPPNSTIGTHSRTASTTRAWSSPARERLALPVHRGFVERIRQITGDDDLITIHHVLEHLAQARSAMHILHGWLRPADHLVVAGDPELALAQPSQAAVPAQPAQAAAPARRRTRTGSARMPRNTSESSHAG